MINIKTEEEIVIMKKAGKINFLTHELIKENIKPGITTKELNDLAHDFILSNDSTPSFLGYSGFPASICASVNDEIVHGIPSNYKLKNGDIISIDIGVYYNGFHSDSARTHIVGNTKNEVRKLVENTEKSLYVGLDVIKDGVKVSEIGKAIEQFAHQNHLSVVEELVGHGVGKDLHEKPDVPNYYTDMSEVLKEGMVIAVEPMLNLGRKEIYLEDDDWTIKTDDELPSAHFEHTVLVTKDGYQILTGE
ncbi:MAG: type I methionyl aminopeptidase [bacterium]